MLDFQSVLERQQTMAELVEGLDAEDLRRLTNEMIDTMLELISESEDADVVFVPDDPDAYDEAAEDEADLHLAWTLGHVIVHATASSEESAALAAELARGAPRRSGRSRYEVPWQMVTTVAHCRRRLEESRRMRLASLDMWPDEPHLDNTYEGRTGRPIDAVQRFVFGLMHDSSHLEQIAKIALQARESRLSPSKTTEQAIAL